jgi:4-amino-4-deoxy-L-arabinose transferase-like glycosyltransferase
MVPVAGWVCAAVAILNAVCWSVITPPFQVPDEPSHFAYVKQLADNHALPSSHKFEFSNEEVRALSDLHEAGIPILPPTGTIASKAEQQKLKHDLAVEAEQPREGSPAAGVATSEPPLYYALEAIPYSIGSHATLLTRLELMRLLSALFAGITAMFVFLFVRETLPASPAAWVGSGLGIAFAPLLGVMSGSVNPDSLLFAISAMAFWALARAFRRGLTYRRAILIGAITAVGLVTKLNFVGLFPGVIIGLAVLAWREARSSRTFAYRAFGLGAGIAALPVVAVALVHLTSSGPTFGFVSSAASLVSHHGTVFSDLSSTWQLFLPHLPGMKHDEPGIFTTRQIWFNGFVGQYGWVETTFPGWVYNVALLFGVAALVACGRTLVLLRRTVRERLAELAVYSSMAAGLVILIGSAAYYGAEAESYTQARYLLPLLALFAAGLGLAIRAAGRRWEPVLAAVVVLALVADNIFSQLLVIARFYG